MSLCSGPIIGSLGFLHYSYLLFLSLQTCRLLASEVKTRPWPSPSELAKSEASNGKEDAITETATESSDKNEAWKTVENSDVAQGEARNSVFFVCAV